MTFVRVVLPTAVGAATVAVAATYWLTPTPAAPVMRVALDVAPAEELNAGGFSSAIGTPGGSRTAVRWTPEGNALVFVGRRNGAQQLFLRRLSGTTAAALAGTEGAQVPIVSPDGRWVLFWANGEIRRAPLGGGPAQTLVGNVPIAPAGMTTSSNGRLYFSAGTPPGEPATESIWTATSNGAVSRVTTQAPGELAHLAPQIVDDRFLLFTVRHTWRGRDQVVALPLEAGTRTVIVEDAADGRYDASTGQLLFMRRTQLMAAPLDIERLRLTGEPIAIVDSVAQALVSPNGVDVTTAGQYDVRGDSLAYVRGAPLELETRRLVVIDRSGHETTLSFEPRAYDTLDLSPDGRYLAVPTSTLQEKRILVADLVRGTLATLPPSGDMGYPRWSPDGLWLAFCRERDGRYELVRQRTDGSAPPEALLPGIWWVSSWSPDGRALAAVHEGDLWVIDLSGPKAVSRALTATPEWDGSPVFSPDGHWLAFASTMNGHREVYIRPFPEDGPATQVSVGGGTNPLWTKNGRELVFIQPAPAQERRYRMVAADIAGRRVGTTRPLFALPPDWGPCLPNPCLAASRDGERFYATGSPTESRTQAPVTHVEIVLNWPGLLRPPKN